MLRVVREDSKFRSQKLQTLCDHLAACSILLRSIFFPYCNMLNVLPYCVNFPIYRFIKPHNRKTQTVNNAHPGYHLFTLSLLAFDYHRHFDSVEISLARTTSRLTKSLFQTTRSSKVNQNLQASILDCLFAAESGWTGRSLYTFHFNFLCKTQI